MGGERSLVIEIIETSNVKKKERAGSLGSQAFAELHEKEKSNMEEREAWKIKYDRLQERMKDVEAELKKFKKS